MTKETTISKDKAAFAVCSASFTIIVLSVFSANMTLQVFRSVQLVQDTRDVFAHWALYDVFYSKAADNLRELRRKDAVPKHVNYGSYPFLESCNVVWDCYGVDISVGGKQQGSWLGLPSPERPESCEWYSVTRKWRKTIEWPEDIKALYTEGTLSLDRALQLVFYIEAVAKHFGYDLPKKGTDWRDPSWQMEPDKQLECIVYALKLEQKQRLSEIAESLNINVSKDMEAPRIFARIDRKLADNLIRVPITNVDLPASPAAWMLLIVASFLFVSIRNQMRYLCQGSASKPSGISILFTGLKGLARLAAILWLAGVMVAPVMLVGTVLYVSEAYADVPVTHHLLRVLCWLTAIAFFVLLEYCALVMAWGTLKVRRELSEILAIPKSPLILLKK